MMHLISGSSRISIADWSVSKEIGFKCGDSVDHVVAKSLLERVEDVFLKQRRLAEGPRGSLAMAAPLGTV